MWFLEKFKQSVEAFFEDNAFLLWALVCLLVGLAILLFVLLRVKSAVNKRKRKRAETERGIEFALPSQENTFVRARLNTVLRIPDEKGMEREEEIPFEELPKLSHARELLAKVKASPLSGAERLETEELAKTLNVFLRREGFSTEDLRILNDTFLRILKLSAKYSV